MRAALVVSIVVLFASHVFAAEPANERFDRFIEAIAKAKAGHTHGFIMVYEDVRAAHDVRQPGRSARPAAPGPI